jgi:hypothetical protein
MLTRQQFASADNQQGTIPQIAWLAGLFDGEGSIGIYDRIARGKYTTWSMRLTLTNTNVVMLDHTKALLDKLGLAYYVQENQKHGNENWRPRWQMLFTGFSRCWFFLKLIRPHLVGKAKEADLALEFLDSRMNTPTASTPYSERDMEIIQLLKDAKRNGHLRD